MHKETFTNLHVSSLRSAEERERFGQGYRYLVYAGTFNHTAFHTKSGLKKFLAHSGLTVKRGFRPFGSRYSFFLEGQYSRVSYYHDENRWHQLRASKSLEEIPIMSNGDYTIGLLERSSHGNSIHYLNPNCSREILDRTDARAQLGES